MSSYLVYICQAVRDRAGLERYWRDAPAAYPKNNVDVLAGYGPCEVLDADQEERVELYVVLSPEFSAGALAVFIPWRVGAEESGAAN